MENKYSVSMFGQKRLTREGGVEIVVKELCTRMARDGYSVTCYNRSGHHVSGSEYDSKEKTEYAGICQKYVPTIEKKGLAAVSSSFLQLCVVPLVNMIRFISMLKVRHFLRGFLKCLEKE